MSFEQAILKLAESMQALAESNLKVAEFVAQNTRALANKPDSTHDPVLKKDETLKLNADVPVKEYADEEPPVAEEPPVKRRRKKTAETAEVAPGPEPEVAEVTAPSLFDDLGLDEPEDIQVTAAMLKEKLGELGRVKGRELVLGIFKEVGAKTFADIQEKDFVKVYKLACDAE